jgi:hypothetical protein
MLPAPGSRPTSKTVEQMQLVNAFCRFVEPVETQAR